MEIRLEKATLSDAPRLWQAQREAFAELLEKYQDHDTNPGAEPLSTIERKVTQQGSTFYLIYAQGELVGAIRIALMPDGVEKRISPLFVLPKYRGKGIAQQAIREVERLHGSENWALETVLQEKGNCYLYEKMGYRQTGKSEAVNDRLTLVLYAK